MLANQEEKNNGRSVPPHPNQCRRTGRTQFRRLLSLAKRTACYQGMRTLDVRLASSCHRSGNNRKSTSSSFGALYEILVLLLCTCP